MLKLASIACCALSVLPSVWAAPAPELEVRHGGRDCISNWEAERLLKQFVSLFEKFDEELTKKTLTEDITVQSASFNFLFGIMVFCPFVAIPILLAISLLRPC